MVNLIRVLIAVCVTVTLVSCSTAKKSEEQKASELKTSKCIDEKTDEVIIKWGYYYRKKSEHYSYKINTNGDIFKLSHKDKEGNRIKNISAEEYCKIYIAVQKEFIKTQTLNVPADRNAYVELVNPEMNMKLRALWNPNYKTVGSEGFRKVWDLLESVLPNSKMLLHKKEDYESTNSR